MIKIVVCNQNKIFAQCLFNSIRVVLSKLKTQCELTFCVELQEIINNLKTDINYYDIIILDAFDLNHLKMVRAIRKKNFFVSVIFTSAGKELIPNLLKFRPTAYISDINSSEQIVSAITNSFNEQKYIRPYFTVKNKDMLMRISFNDIQYFESKKRIVALYTQNQVIEFYSKLDDVDALLPHDSFVRCHQSYIINLEKVKKLDKVNRCLITDKNQEIEISRSYYAQIVENFNRFMR